MGFDVIIDTREKHPVSFKSADISSITYKKLETGDYCLQGMEELLFIERKGSTKELYINVAQARFWDELDRAIDFPHKYLILEFSKEDVEMFPYNSGIPQKRWKYLQINKEYLKNCIIKIAVQYQINVIFVNNAQQTEEKLLEIFTNVSKT